MKELRFMLWLVVWIIAVSIVALLGCVGFTLVIVCISGHVPSNWSAIPLQIPIVGLILGGCLYVINLPFMILALRSSFFRERFYECLRIKSMPTISGQSDTDLSGNQSPESKTSENHPLLSENT